MIFLFSRQWAREELVEQHDIQGHFACLINRNVFVV